LQNVSDLHRLNELRGDLLERLGFRLRGDAESIMLATSLLEDESLDSEMRAEIIAVLAERTASAMDVIEKVRTHLEVPSSSSSHAAQPLDAMALLQRATIHAEGAAASRRVEIAVTAPHLPSLVSGEPAALLALYSAILSLLVQDAGEDTRLTVTVTEDEDFQRVHFANAGFGIPAERFHHYLDASDAAAGPEFERLRQGRKAAGSWGGRLEGTAAIGQGIEISVTLKIAI
ncbi:MAG TPA: hypothetical protein VLA56_03380, partial [Pseudomonadales bacterium]|nr:hypothetical protein [Pseudomonadales bacterium]